MKESLPIQVENGREALLVKLAKELSMPPAQFIRLDAELRRSTTIGVMAAISLSPNISEDLESQRDKIWQAGIDAGVLRPEDAEDVF